ncbi:hypothetical protein KI387_014813, partial [Taxus chinensis]
MAAPAPTSPAPSNDDASFHCYDVFINHRGPDVKNSVASVVHQFLNCLGLKPFLDSTEFQTGANISVNIQHAIQSSAVHIAIFSERYASSPWCLAELCLMLETGAKIVPVFYDVTPSDLRYIEKGRYATAFTTYEEKQRHVNWLDEWKRALHKVSFINGIGFDSSNGNMGKLCKNIVDTVVNEVGKVKIKCELEIAEHPFGLDEAIQELEAKISSWGQINNGDGKIVGIVGGR